MNSHIRVPHRYWKQKFWRRLQEGKMLGLFFPNWRDRGVVEVVDDGVKREDTSCLPKVCPTQYTFLCHTVTNLSLRFFSIIWFILSPSHSWTLHGHNNTTLINFVRSVLWIKQKVPTRLYQSKMNNYQSLFFFLQSYLYLFVDTICICCLGSSIEECLVGVRKVRGKTCKNRAFGWGSPFRKQTKNGQNM